MPRKSVRNPGGTKDPTRERALRPVETDPGVLVHSTSDRRLATEHWLLAGSRNRDRTRMEWQEQGVALLPLGVRFAAVRLPASLVLAAACLPWELARVDSFLDEVLDGGPVICDPHGRRYYALVPASVPVTWRQAVDDWRSFDVDCLGRESYLGVPRVDAVDCDPPCASYWSVPMSSAGVLCGPLNVARLIAAGRHRMVDEDR